MNTTNTSKAKLTAVEAARKAGKLIKERVGNIDRIDYKGAFNLVTDVDKASEKLIIETIRSIFPDDAILAEESGGEERSIGRRWLIDPLDGTTNFAHAYPFFSVSIALEVDGDIVVGVVYNPISDELFEAEKGQGSYLNGKKIQVSQIPTLEESLLATGFPPDTLGGVINNMVGYSTLTNLTHGVRRDGSAALDLSFVACGRMEGFWEFKLAPWDVAAGSLLVTEAGGRVTAPSGGAMISSAGHILASNGKIHDAVIKALKDAKVGIPEGTAGTV